MKVYKSGRLYTIEKKGEVIARLKEKDMEKLMSEYKRLAAAEQKEER